MIIIDYKKKNRNYAVKLLKLQGGSLRKITIKACGVVLQGQALYSSLSGK